MVIKTDLDNEEALPISGAHVVVMSPFRALCGERVEGWEFMKVSDGHPHCLSCQKELGPTEEVDAR